MISCGVSINTSNGFNKNMDKIVNINVVKIPISMDPATAFFILCVSPEPNALAITIEKPAPKLIEKPTSNSKIEAVAPTAANEFSPRTCPTIAVSTALYNCWKQFEIKIGIMKIIRFFKIGPCNKSTEPFTLSLRIFYPSILYNYNLWSNLKQCSLNAFSICIK